MPAGGAQTTVTAPVAGTLGAEQSRAGGRRDVEKGQIVLTLVPLAPAERDVRIEAERVVGEAEAGRRWRPSAPSARDSWRATAPAVSAPPKKPRPTSRSPMPR